MVKNIRKRGFALAELAIIVAIVAILAAILIPTLSGVFKNVPIAGEDGLTPNIGENGNWWLGDVDTEVSAEGRDGRDVAFRVDSGHIQMQYDGETTWTNLIDITTLVGATGPAGSDGADGRDVKLRVSDGFIQWQYDGDVAWTDLISLASLTGADGVNGTNGADGREVEMRVSGTFIQWRYAGADVWTDLVSLATLTGPAGVDGTDGKEVEMQVASGFIQWRYVGDTVWSDLIALATLTGPTGPTGPAGVDGTDGTDGTDGKEVEMQVASGFIQWRYVGDTVWKDLVSLATLTGPTGPAGVDGTDGTDGREVEMQSAGGFIQWRYVGDASWTNLVDLSTMTGADGVDGLSAFELYKVYNPNYYKTEAEWVTDLVRGKLSDSDTVDILDYNQLLVALAAGDTKIQLQNDILATADVVFDYLIDVNFNGYELDGNLVIDTLEAGTMNLTGEGTLTGNLTVDAANASIYSDLNVNGTTTIIAISGSTFNTTGTHTGGIYIVSGGRIVTSGDATTSTIYIDAVAGEDVIISGTVANIVIIGDSNVIISDANIGNIEIQGTANVQIIEGSNVGSIDGTTPEGLNSQIEVSLDSIVPSYGPDNNINQTGYSAEFVTTEATGFHLGVLYQQFELIADEVIDLSDSNIASIIMKDPTGADHVLIPDSDTTLWFNVESAAGTYIFTVEDIAGTSYVADLVWGGIEEVASQFTGGIGVPPLPNPQEIYKEYALGALDLSSFDVMYSVNPAGEDKELVANTDTTLWFNSTAVSGTYTYYVRQNGDWFKSELVHVNEVAEFTSSDATGFHNDNLYEEFVLSYNGTPISLAATAVSYIAQDEVELIPDTDTTLWFNVNKAAGTYEFVVVTITGDVYTSSIVWDGIEEVDAILTGNFGTHELVTYVEYQLGALDLSSFDIMYSVDPSNLVTELVANTDVNLWFNVESDEGIYTFYIKQGSVWSKAEVSWPALYTIEFESNGGSEVAPIVQGYGTEVSEPVAPTKLGATLVGWFVDEELTIPYTFTTMPINGIKLYAKWDIASYKLTLMKDGVLFGSQTLEFNSPITIVNPFKTGYTFNGWYSDSDFTTIFTDTNMPAYDVTLYAKFTINQYTISFLDFDLEVMESYVFDYNQLITGVDYPAIPVKTGYTFVQWSEVIPTNMPASNVDIIAEFEIDQYTITWKINGDETVETYSYGATIIEPSNPTKVGYTFISWDTEVPETMPDANLIITAQFVINEYKIDFSVDGEIEAQIMFDYNELINVYIPEKPGYRFEGWFEDELFEIPFTLTHMPANDIIVYAKMHLIDVIDPLITEATVEKDSNGDLILTVIASDEYLYSLEVDHSLEAVLPEFSVYASETNPWGTTEDQTQFEAAGVDVSYNAATQTWVLVFALDGQAMQVINDPLGSNGAISFFLVVLDEEGNSSGSMYDGTYLTVSQPAN